MFQDPNASDDDAYDSTSEDADNLEDGSDEESDEESSSESDVEISEEIQGKDIPVMIHGPPMQHHNIIGSYIVISPVYRRNEVSNMPCVTNLLGL